MRGEPPFVDDKFLFHLRFFFVEVEIRRKLLDCRALLIRIRASRWPRANRLPAAFAHPGGLATYKLIEVAFLSARCLIFDEQSKVTRVKLLNQSSQLICSNDSSPL